jgi:Ferritin-like
MNTSQTPESAPHGDFSSLTGTRRRNGEQRMSSPQITTREQLHQYLYAALQLEHATIPPYLTALYSIRPGTNAEAYHVLRLTAVEEMLHLTLVANLLNAVDGAPDLTKPGFVPEYPAYLPDGETDLEVSRRRFSREALQTFLNIQRPRRAPDDSTRLVDRVQARPNRLGVRPDQPTMQFYSIGEFYSEIWRGVQHLYDELDDDLFCGDPARQVTSKYFYSGGHEVIPVTNLASAKKAIELIAKQCEGFGGTIHDAELAPYYRFEQLALGRCYRSGDQAGQPTGPELHVDWDAAFPIKTDANLADYPPDSEVYRAAEDFNRTYADFLDLLTEAYNGRPELLLDAVVEMFRIRDLMTRLMHNPIPGQSHLNAAATFELALQPAPVLS